jgi:hypothetical protein
VLRALGCGGCRINVCPSRFLKNGNWNEPDVHVIDASVKLAHEHGITPVLLLEYYAEYIQNEGLGTREQWFEIGKAFAARFKPNGTWGQENDVADWGITVYTAFNEPEQGFGAGGKIDPQRYVDSLHGYADGVHDVDPTLEVVPGGFMAANAWNDWTLRGLGTAIAPLLNDGTLSGIDLHTYFDVQWAPMENGYGDSAQSSFDDIKRACGITADIGFYSTEFNYKHRAVTEEAAAKGFLTALWDTLGVVGSDGATPRTKIAFPWNIFNRSTDDAEFGICTELEPWTPTARGEVLRMVARLAAGKRFVSSAPRTLGVFVLEGGGAKLWVWQNRNGWTNRPGESFTVEGIPAGTRELAEYGYGGRRRTIDVSGRAARTDVPEAFDERFRVRAAVVPSCGQGERDEDQQTRRQSVRSRHAAADSIIAVVGARGRRPGRGVGRVGRAVAVPDVQTVEDAVAVFVGNERVEARGGLRAVQHAVAVGVVRHRVGEVHVDLVAVGQPVVVGVEPSSV